MSDIDLDKYSEITDLNADGENPHIAICHKAQGYSANNRHQALLFKGTSVEVPVELLKALDGKVDEVVIQKMTYENKRKALEEAVTERIRANMSGNGEYVWVSISDFNDDMVVFYYADNLFAVEYTENDGVVDVGEEPKSVKRRDLYIDSETGEELIKAAQWLKKTGEEVSPQENPEIKGEESSLEDGEQSVGADPISPVSKDDEDIMTDVTKPVEEEVVVKSQAELQDIIKAAIEADRKEQELVRKAAETEAKTVEVIKSIDALKEFDAVELVKSLLVVKDYELILKALMDTQEAVVKAKEEAAAEIEEIKKEFGKQESVDLEAKDKVVKGADKNLDLDSFVKKFKK